MNIKKYSSVFIALCMLFGVKWANADVLLPGIVYGCGEIASIGTYTLSSTSTFSVGGPGNVCFNVTSGGNVGDTIIDGNNRTVDGDIIGDGVNLGDPGHNFTLQNITVTGSVTSNGMAGDTPSIPILPFSNGGNGGAISIINSTLTVVSSNGGEANDGFQAGNGGNIILSTSTATDIVSNGGVITGICASSGSGVGNGGVVSVSNSTLTSMSTNGGNSMVTCISGGNGGTLIGLNSTVSSYNSNGGNGYGVGDLSVNSANGNGGSIVITTTVLNLTGVTISANPGTTVSDNNNPPTNDATGTLALNYTNFDYTGISLQSFSDLVINGPGNLPGDIGSFAGGLLSSYFSYSTTITDSSQCNLSHPDTYILANDITGDCHITKNGIIINGAGHTINGNVIGDGVNLTESGHNFTLKDITVTGAISSIGGGVDCSSTCIRAGVGGNITILNSTTTSVSANSGGGYYGNSGGSITIANSTTTSVSADAQGSGPLGGNGGTINILNSVTTSVSANSKELISQDSNNNVSYAGSITITNSTTTSVSANGISSNNGSLGGTIVISNSAVTDISATGSSLSWSGGNGGSVSVSNSKLNSIDVSGGSVDLTLQSGGNGGNGGTITVSNIDLDLASKTINSVLGTGDTANGGADGTNGTVSLSYNSLNTNNSTFIYGASSLTANDFSYGPWNGVFNPHIYYFNDTASGAGHDGDWANPLNWWNDVNFTAPAGDIPGSINEVIVYGNITTNSATSTAVADKITFNHSSSNGISITTNRGAVFNDTSTNIGSINGSVIFNGDGSTDTGGTITGTVTRLYTTNATTTRNFKIEGGRNNWKIIANGAVVDIEGATYATTTDIFSALNGGMFIYDSNPSGPVVPSLTINSPATSTITKWLPSIGWDTSSVCEYSYNNFSTSSVVSCSNGGSDIPRPSAGVSHTIYFKGITIHGSSFETIGQTFFYDNTVPTYTLCGSDLMDEASRPYYYLAGNVTGDCKATVNTTLYGTSTINALTPGYTINGNVIANAPSANGLNINLKNIHVTGSVMTNGADNIGTGFNGGSVNIATSTTGAVLSNGGNGTTKGGNGGAISIINSIQVASSTQVSANGGNATMCGRGGSGGTVSLINSTYDVVTINAGNDQTAIGAGLCTATPSGSSGSGGISSVSGVYNPISSSGQTNTDANTNTPAPVGGADNHPTFTAISSGGTIAIPVNKVAEINLPEIKPVDLPVNHVGPLAIAQEALKNIANNTNSVVNSQVSDTVKTVGFIAGLISLASTLFSTPLLAGEILLLPIRLWGLVLTAFGLKRRIPPWGTVYDSVTKRPIDPAYVTVRDMSGKVIAESMTDIDGRYGFFLPDGKYLLSAQKTNYEFPSQKMVGKSADEMYRDLYFGESIEVVGGQVIDKNIPMDPLNFDWNESAKNEHQEVMSFHKRHEKLIRVASDIVFRFGLVISVISIILNPSTYNIIMIVTYLIVFAFSFLGIKGRKFGIVRDSSTGKPMPFAIFRVTTLDHQIVLRSGVTDALGRYYCIVPKGEYFVDIEKKYPDGSYVTVFESDVINSNSGLINKNFLV